MMRLTETLVVVSLLAASGAIATTGAQKKDDKGASSDQEYEFSDEDMRQIVAKIAESLLALERPGFAEARVAWLRLRNDTEERKLQMLPLMEAVEVALIKSGRCKVLRRADLEVIAREHSLAMTALMSPETVSQMRDLAGVDYWLSATLSARTNREDGKEYVYYNFTSFLTDAKSTERVWGEIAEIKKMRGLQMVEKRLKGDN